MNQYQLFCEWLRNCPAEITNFQDNTDYFNVTIHVPLEEENVSQ